VDRRAPNCHESPAGMRATTTHDWGSRTKVRFPRRISCCWAGPSRRFTFPESWFPQRGCGSTVGVCSFLYVRQISAHTRPHERIRSEDEHTRLVPELASGVDRESVERCRWIEIGNLLSVPKRCYPPFAPTWSGAQRQCPEQPHAGPDWPCLETQSHTVPRWLPAKSCSGTMLQRARLACCESVLPSGLTARVMDG
jgi:hypothetical protein